MLCLILWGALDLGKLVECMLSACTRLCFWCIFVGVIFRIVFEFTRRSLLPYTPVAMTTSLGLLSADLSEEVYLSNNSKCFINWHDLALKARLKVSTLWISFLRFAGRKLEMSWQNVVGFDVLGVCSLILDGMSPIRVLQIIFVILSIVESSFV